MASGIIQLNNSKVVDGGRHVEGKIEWSSVSNDTNNNASVTARLFVRKAANVSLTQATSGTWQYTLTINGQSKKGSYYTKVLTSWVEICSLTVDNIDYGSSSFKTIDIYGKAIHPNVTTLSGAITEGTETIELDPIFKGSEISAINNIVLPDVCQIKWTPYSRDYHYKLEFKLGETVVSQTGIISPDSISEYTYNYTFNPSLWGSRILTSKSVQCTVVLSTYKASDGAESNKIGQSSKNIIITIPDSAAPTIGSFNWELKSTSQSNSFIVKGVYLQGLNTFKFYLTDCNVSTLYGAGVSIVRYNIYDNKGALIYSDTICPTSTSPIEIGINTPGDFDFYAQIEDSRGFVSAVKFARKLTVLSYAPPTISFTATRSLTDDSAVTVSYKASCFDVRTDSEVLNSITKVEFYKAGSSTLLGSDTYSTQGIVREKSKTFTFGTDPGNIIARVYDKAYVAGTENYGRSEQYVGSPVRFININFDQSNIGLGRLANKSESIKNQIDCNLQLNLKTEYTVTSDRNEKNSIADMGNAQEELFNKLIPVTYKLNKGESGRTHYGFIAQDVEAAMDDVGISNIDFAGFCKTPKTDPYGNFILSEDGEQEYSYTLRYGEFVALNTYMIQKLYKENKILKKRLDDILKIIKIEET